jgi:hypothetical protein
MSKGQEVATAVSGLLNNNGNEERKVFIEQMSRDILPILDQHALPRF